MKKIRNKGGKMGIGILIVVVGSLLYKGKDGAKNIKIENIKIENKKSKT